MKKSLFILLLSFVAHQAIADCSGGGISFFPQSKEIGLNSRFMIEGYGLSQKMVKRFKKRKIYLVSEAEDSVELNLLEILNSQMHLTQAIFKPAKELKPHTTYHLKYDQQTRTEEEEMLQFDSEKGTFEIISWKTIDKIAYRQKTRRIDSLFNIEFEKTEHEYYGCGPSANAIFSVNNKPDSEVWYRTEVVNLQTGKSSMYWIRDWSGRLSVGHGMCAGAFLYSMTGHYKVRFTPMNINGKYYKTTDWTTFESPYVNDNGN